MVVATLLRLNEWVESLQTIGREVVLRPTAVDPIEQIADDLVEPARESERQLLLKPLQEALFYCVGFATSLT